MRLTTSQAGERTRFSFTVVMPIGDPKDRQATKIADLFLLGYGCTDVACGHVDFYREPGPEKPA